MDQHVFTTVERIGAFLSGASGNLVTDLFRICVSFMYYVSGLIGISYEAMNIWLFIIIQPGLILLLFVLWLKGRTKQSRT